MEIPSLPAHPRLLMTSQGIAEMKNRVEHCDWARAQWETAKKMADDDLGKEIALPPRGSNWFHWYACPVHGCGLHTGKQIGPWQWEHICPVGKEVLLGDPTKPEKDYDGCELSRIHHGWSQAVRDLGIAYQMTGDARYAAKARGILLAYADKYLTYPLHNIHGEPKIGGGRIGCQNLDESVWLIPICQGADLIWDTLSQADKDAISAKMLLPAAKEVIMPRPNGIHNIQNWRNSAMGLVGFLLGDKDLIQDAIYDAKTGFLEQMSKGVTADGGWWEGAWGYHFYTMSAIWGLTEAAKNCGIDLYCPEYKRMFDAPLQLATPGMTLPPFNDSGTVNLRTGDDLYELAYARYKDPLCLELLSKSDRHNDFALWFGEPKLPSPPQAQWKSRNYPRTGYAILTKGKGEQATWLCMKYGPHGGGHGHPDKLNFVVYARGQTIGIDPGTARYGLPIEAGWYKTTLAHNTLTVDEQNQKQAEGHSIAFGSENGVDYAMCDAGSVCDGVSFTRTAALVSENLLVFIDQIKSDKEHTFDVAYHQRGEWTGLPRGFAWTPPDIHGYSYLKDATSRKTTNGIDLNAEVSKGLSVAIGLAGGESTEVITATGVGSNIADRVPTVIFRRQARDTAYVWFVSLDGKPASIDRLSVHDVSGKELGADVTAIRVAASGGEKLNLVANPKKQAVVVKLSDGSDWRVSSAFSVKQLR